MTSEVKFEDGKLIVSRVYSAKREYVFEARVETSRVQQWWGCAQSTEYEPPALPTSRSCPTAVAR